MGGKGFAHRIRPTSLSDVLEQSLRQALEMTSCTYAVAWLGLHWRCTTGRRREASAAGSSAVAGTMAQILVENLTKTFRVAKRRAGLWGAVTGLVHRMYYDIPALAGIDFTIEESELVGYIGPNGAGKSTTVKILSGILVPTAGRCEVHGRLQWNNRLQLWQHIAR